MAKIQQGWSRVLVKFKEVKKRSKGLDSFQEMVLQSGTDAEKEFFESVKLHEHKNFVLFRYSVDCFQAGMWDRFEGLYRECRSIVIDKETEKLVITPFDKFFNIGERPDTSVEAIAEKILSAQIVEFANKLDGSMQCLRYYNGEYVMCGASSLDTDKSWRLKEGYFLLTDNVKQMARENHNLSFTFETILQEETNIVSYSEEELGLHLIGVRDVDSGKEFHYYEIESLAQQYGVRCAEIETLTLEDALEQSKTISANEKEGWVVNIDGFRVKLKGDDYCQIHKLLDIYSSHNLLIEKVAKGEVDDILSKVPAANQGRILQTVSEIEGFRSDIVKKAVQLLSTLSNESRGVDMRIIHESQMFTDKDLNKKVWGVAVARYDEKDVDPLLSKTGYVKWRLVDKWKKELQ